MNNKKKTYNRLTEKQLEIASYELWYNDWLEVIKESPDFQMTYNIKNNNLDAKPILKIQVDENTPQKYKMTVMEVFFMTKEKMVLLQNFKK